MSFVVKVIKYGNYWINLTNFGSIFEIKLETKNVANSFAMSACQFACNNLKIIEYILIKFDVNLFD
jgi:hypothetical protein